MMAAGDREVRHPQAAATALVDDRHPGELVDVARDGVPHVLKEPVIDLVDDLQVTREEVLEHAHGPLIAMLVLTQIAAGIFLSATALALGDVDIFTHAQAPLAVAAFAILNLGLAVSVLHLGRPLGAWRAFLGLRTSWMSREILAFSIFAGAAAAFTLSAAASL